MFGFPTRRRTVIIGGALAAGLAVVMPLLPAAASTGAAISGRAFQDVNRNQVADAGEPVFSGHQLYLFDSSGAFRAMATTGSDGRYSMSGLASGSYTLEYSSSSWSPLRHGWTPTTTGSLRPSKAVALETAATVDFGWRPVQWSTDVNAPLSRFTGPSGVVTESFNDALPAVDIHTTLLGGSLRGAEAANTTVRVGYGDISEAPTGIGSSNGVYNTFSSVDYISWNAWLDDAEASLFHEYGHSWSLYNAYIVQQDGTFSSYLEARGLSGDSRIGSSYEWSAGEMIAEDYRQLFGSPTGQLRPQANTQIPPPAAVPGLRQFLAETYTTAPATTPPAPLTISNLAVSPRDITKTGTISYSLSAPATVTVAVFDSAGNRVRLLRNGVSQPAGAASVTWDRNNDSGRRVKAGPYGIRVDATGPNGSASAGASVTVR